MEPFKNWLNEKAAGRIAQALHRADPHFSPKEFMRGLPAALEPLALKGRMVFLADRIHSFLPQDPKKSFPLLMQALRCDENDEMGLSGFQVWPLTHVVAKHGQDHFDLSMKALHAMTQVFTAEFAIRPFLVNHETKTIKTLRSWTVDPSAHVRRLCSEGSRPLLPWGEKLPRFVHEPERTWDILHALRFDDSEYVRKSVANHLNDHTKNHGDWVVKKLKAWRGEAKENAQLEWVIRHGTRTLVKKGHVGALALHGVKPGVIEVKKMKILTQKVVLGEFLAVEVTLKNVGSKTENVVVDHQLSLLGSRDQQRTKVLKGKKLTLPAGASETLAMRMRLKPVTVRAYYEGKQGWSVLVNGVRSKELPFYLEIP